MQSGKSDGIGSGSVNLSWNTQGPQTLPMLTSHSSGPRARRFRPRSAEFESFGKPDGRDSAGRMSVVNRMFVYVLLAVAMVLSVDCTGNRSASEDIEALIDQVRHADQVLLKAEQQRDLVSAMALVAPHAVFQPPGFPAIVGDEAIRRFYEEDWFTLPYVEIFGQADTIVVAASGDLAYVDGRSYLMLEISGEKVRSEGKYLGVWQRIEGQWRLVAMSWTANEPAR